METTSIIEKIKKLFAIANRKSNNDGSSNEAEAAAAMEMAQTLLAKYNLDLRTIQDTEKATGTAQEVGGKREKTQINRSAMYRWQQQFWKALAEANYCFHWVTEVREPYQKKYSWGMVTHYRKVKRHVILGSEANVAVVQMMGEYLTEVMERLLPFSNTERLSNSALSWREGCAERLIERIKAKMERMKAEGVTSEGVACTALAVRDMAEAEYAANYDAQYGKGVHARSLARNAEWEAGRAAREAEEATKLVKLQEERAKETPAQREKREAKERREQEREERRWQRESYREACRLDGASYNAGRRKANDINLDSQIKK
jgi:hypothetical protein